MKAADFYARFRSEASKAIVGQDDAVRLCALALIAQGHVLLEGVPGVGKTLLAKTIARLLSLQYGRVQFTPDLMPADIVGTSVYDLQSRSFRVRQGPVFTNILLADEINRAPAKVQAALLESMEERGVSLEGQQLPLPDPFMVLATQNPIEYEGTYPLRSATGSFPLQGRDGLPHPDAGAGDAEAVGCRHRAEGSGARRCRASAGCGRHHRMPRGSAQGHGRGEGATLHHRAGRLDPPGGRAGTGRESEGRSAPDARGQGRRGVRRARLCDAG